MGFENSHPCFRVVSQLGTYFPVIRGQPQMWVGAGLAQDMLPQMAYELHGASELVGR